MPKAGEGAEMNELLIEKLNRRYATKVFDPEKPVSDEDWATLEEALRLTPSSYGLQPWKFLVVRDQAVKDLLLPVSWNQSQIVDCSHLVVITVRKSVTGEDVDKLIAATAAARGTDVDSLEFYKKMIIGDVVEGPRSGDAIGWAKLQSYIALGNLMTCAAMLDIDCCPMEGFQPEKYDEVLGLAEKGLTTSVVCAVGYRAEDDKYATAAKVRYPRDDVFETI